MAKTHITYALLISLAMIIAGVAVHVAGLSFEPWAPWVSPIILLIGLLLNAVAFSKANDHNVTFGNVFSSSFKATAIITLIMIAWSFVSLMIFPEIKEQAIEKALEKMEAQGNDEEAIEMGINMTRQYFNIFMVAGVLFSTLFFGAIFSLIGAAIAKKNPHPQQLS